MQSLPNFHIVSVAFVNDMTAMFIIWVLLFAFLQTSIWCVTAVLIHVTIMKPELMRANNHLALAVVYGDRHCVVEPSVGLDLICMSCTISAFMCVCVYQHDFWVQLETMYIVFQRNHIICDLLKMFLVFWKFSCSVICCS